MMKSLAVFLWAVAVLLTGARAQADPFHPTATMTIGSLTYYVMRSNNPHYTWILKPADGDDREYHVDCQHGIEELVYYDGIGGHAWQSGPFVQLVCEQLLKANIGRQ